MEIDEIDIVDLLQLEIEERTITNQGTYNDYIAHCSEVVQEKIDKLQTVQNMEFATEYGKQKRCKDCKYFEYDSVVKVDGIPLIVAHKICSKLGNGCKTSEDAYCLLFEPQIESEE